MGSIRRMVALATVALFIAAGLRLATSAAPAQALSDTSCNGDIALIRVRGSGDKLATAALLSDPTRGTGNSGKQLTLDAVSKAFHESVEHAGLTVNEYDLPYPRRGA